MSWLVAALALAAGLRALAWGVLHLATQRPLRRAARLGRVDPSPGEEVRSVRLNAMGINPGLETRYLPFRIPRGAVGLVRGRAHPDATYLSVLVYDRLLASVPPGEGGPTWVVDPPRDEDGGFTLVLAHEDPGVPGWIDISLVPAGVLWERHVGPVPRGRTRLEIRASWPPPEDEDSALDPRCSAGRGAGRSGGV